MVSPNSSQIIAVLGATGAQGGSVINALLKESKFKIRAITRNPKSEAAIALLTKGVHEVVQADTDDIESLKTAFNGCYGAFIVTNFWADMNMDHEIEQIKNCQNAASQTKLQHVIFSTLEDTREYVSKESDWKILNETHQSYVPHLDSKGGQTKEFAQAVPTTSLLTSFYYENFIHFGMGPKRGSDGKLAITFPLGDVKMPMVAVSDIGRMVVALFNDPNSINKTQGIMSELLSMQQVADIFSKVLGEPVVYNNVPVDVYASFGFPGANDLANMFRFKRDFPEVFQQNRHIDTITPYLSELESLENWITLNKEAFKN